MDKLLQILAELKLPFAYDHFAEGEAPAPPFICYLLPGSHNYSADGRVYYKINEVNIELYCDCKDPKTEATLEAVLDEHGIFYGLKVKSFMKSSTHLKWRFNHYG